MCCDGDQLQPVVDELAATRAQPEREAKPGLVLEYGPAMILNPITGKRDLPLVRNMRQILINGMRIGYLTTDPGGAICLLRPWADVQLAAIKAAIAEEMALAGFDLEKSRRFHAPQHDGLVADEDEDSGDGDDSPTIILPD